MRTLRLLATAALVAALLTGCSPQVPFTESFRTAIPAALLDSDLGVISSSADTSISGFAVSITVTLVIDHPEMTADELTQLLTIIVENNNLSNPHALSIYANYESATSFDDVDLGSLAAQQGLEQQTSGNFSADWDDVVTFVRENNHD